MATIPTCPPAALLVLVLVIGGCLGWISYNAAVQRDLVTALKDAGHTWAFNWERNDGKPNPSGKPWAPIWLLERIGHHYFGRVTYVQFWIPLDGSGADEDLPLIRHLSSLEELDLQGTRVSDAGLANLEGMTHLQRLEFSCGDVTDAGMAHLKGLANLRVLNLEGNLAISDSGMAHLKGLTSLRILKIINHEGSLVMSDAGMANLDGLTSLKTLVISGAKFSASGLSHLRG